jgi:hypothetical protein
MITTNNWGFGWCIGPTPLPYCQNVGLCHWWPLFFFISVPSYTPHLFQLDCFLDFSFKGWWCHTSKHCVHIPCMPASMVILLHSLDPMFNKSLQPLPQFVISTAANCRCALSCFLPEKQKSVLVALISISNEKNSFTLLLKNLLFYTDTYTWCLSHVPKRICNSHANQFLSSKQVHVWWHCKNSTPKTK